MAVVALVAMMLLTSSDVILRYLGYPIPGSYEVVGFLAAIVIAFPIAYTQILRGHIAIEFLVSHFPKRAQTVIDSITCVLSIGVFSLLAWQCSVLATKLWSLGRVSETLEMPFFPFVYGVAFGCAIMCVVLLIDLSNSLAQLVRK